MTFRCMYMCLKIEVTTRGRGCRHVAVDILHLYFVVSLTNACSTKILIMLFLVHQKHNDHKLLKNLENLKIIIRFAYRAGQVFQNNGSWIIQHPDKGVRCCRRDRPFPQSRYMGIGEVSPKMSEILDANFDHRFELEEETELSI